VTPQDLEANIEIIRDAGIVLAQLEIPLETVECLASICARENVSLILDPAPARDLAASMFKHIEWFTPNQTEAAFYAASERGKGPISDPAELAGILLSRGCQGLVLKMGEQGVYVASQRGPGGEVPAFPVKAIDTTAAGDAFNGGFATALMLGKTPMESARFASAVAAISVTRHGAQPSMPAMAEVEAFMDKEAARTP
jgi:ribokinase